jgi:hypothetical protein
LIYLFISKALRKEQPLCKKDVLSRALLNISFRVSSNGALPPGPPHAVPLDRDDPFLMCHIILPGVACPVLKYFSTSSHKWHNFWEKLLNIKCVFWFSLQLLSETFLILIIIQGDVIINVHTSSCNVRVIIVRF